MAGTPAVVNELRDPKLAPGEELRLFIGHTRGYVRLTILSGFGSPKAQRQTPCYVHSGWVIEPCVYVMEEGVHRVQDTHARDK